MMARRETIQNALETLTSAMEHQCELFYDDTASYERDAIETMMARACDLTSELLRGKA